MIYFEFLHVIIQSSIIYFDIVNKLSMNNPPQNVPIPVNANPQINLVANLQINNNPNPTEKTPVAVPVNDNPNNVPHIDNAVLISGTNSNTPVAVPFSDNNDDQYEQEYDTGHEFMDLQEELDFDDEINTKIIKLCLCRIRTDLLSPFLEFLIERTDDIPQFHLPLYTPSHFSSARKQLPLSPIKADEVGDLVMQSRKTGDADDNKNNTILQNNLLRKIETLLNNDETLETPRFLGFQTHEDIIVAFYDLSVYSTSSLENDGSVQWVILNQITEENGFHQDTLDFFQNNVHIRTLYHLPTQEEVPPPVLVYHSFQNATRTDDLIFGFPFIFTENPTNPVEILSKQKTQESESENKTVLTDTGDISTKPDENTPVEKDKDNSQNKKSFLSNLNPLSTTEKSYPFILFPPPLEKTLVILKQEFQNISPELLKKYSNVFLKKSCIRFLKNGTDYWIVKSPVVAFPYSPFKPFNKKQGTFLSNSTRVSFLPEKTTSSPLTASLNHPVANGKNNQSSFHLNLQNLLNPHRITERANMIKVH